MDILQVKPGKLELPDQDFFKAAKIGNQLGLRYLGHKGAVNPGHDLGTF